jgi:hypothetical protein
MSLHRVSWCQMRITMDKLQLTGKNLGRVFNLRFDHLDAEHFWCYQVKLPNLNSKTRLKQLLGSLPLVIALPGITHHHHQCGYIFIFFNEFSNPATGRSSTFFAEYFC